MSSAEATGPRHPRNPWFGLLYGVILSIGTVGGAIMFAAGWREALAGDMVGQRTEGFVLVAPFLTAAGAVFLLVRGIRAIGPWLRYRAATPPEDRRLALAHDRSLARGALVGAWIVGLLAAAGVVIFAIARPGGALGVGVLLEFVMLLLCLAIVALKGAGQAVWANRYLTERGIPVAATALPSAPPPPASTLPPPSPRDRRPD